MSSAKKALREVLAALDGWVEGAQSNHEAMGHRDTDCCTTFHPDDIRSMVADAARSIKTKKRRKEARAMQAQVARVVVEIEDGITGTRHSRIITPGDVYTLNMQGFYTLNVQDSLVSLDGLKPISKIDVPIMIRARIA